MGGTIINHMLYADDVLFLFLHPDCNVKLLNISNDYCEWHDLMFNANKSMCMYFSININKHCGLPVIYLGNCVCQFVKEVKYLDVMIQSFMKTITDVASQTRYMQAIFLIRNFRYCQVSSAHSFSHVVLICIVVSYGLTLRK